ncbi:MAG: hypothetical protein HY360_08940 [Verrucomicrobia bacterium]|nr:hypothetical protein [Verrucomicrobiota bacterium]
MKRHSQTIDNVVAAVYDRRWALLDGKRGTAVIDRRYKWRLCPDQGLATPMEFLQYLEENS